MKKLRVVFLFVFLLGCSTAQNTSPTATLDIVRTPSLMPTQTVIPPTQTLTPVPTFTPTLTPTAAGGGAGKIAFVSERDGYLEIYVINSDGSHLTKLANDITPKFGPAWSPDGKKIAFSSSNDETASLYIMNADGSNPAILINTKEISVYDQLKPNLQFGSGCCSPAWSPDGTKLVFVATHRIDRSYTSAYMHVLNANGSSLSNAALPGWETLNWSPDSQKIAFGGECEGVFGICVMNADGTNLTSLTHEPGSSGGDTWPVWSPDGTKIAFTSGRNGDAEIFLMNADGSGQINLTKYGSAWDGIPLWSPDGNKIAFYSYRDGNYEIYVMNTDGSNQINLTNHSANDNHPIWSPDSTKIAFVTDRDGNSEIYVVDVDSSNLVRLTTNDANDDSPVWSP